MSLIPIIPKMTSNTTPEGTAAASSSLGAAFAAWKAFDQVQASLSTMQGGWLATSSDVSPTLSYEFSLPKQLNSLYIETANNGATLTVIAFIEGFINGTWENILYSGESVNLTFTQGSYAEYNIILNGNTYSAIRIRGNETWYKGVNLTACTISRMQAYYDDTPPVPPTGEFPIIIQKNNSEPIHLTKDLTNILSTSVWLKEDTSIIDPVFVLEATLSDLIEVNYVTVPTFGRSYFITNITSISTDLVELTCHVDVLSSFADEIKANKGIIFRQENEWNLYLNDGVIQAYQDPIVTTQLFPKGFTQQNFVLVAAGSRNIGSIGVGQGGSIDMDISDGGGAGNTSSKTTAGLIAYCKAQIGNPYWFGTFGNTASQSLLDYKREQYPTYYPDPGSPDFTTQFGQRVHDCVGLIKGYRWSDTPTSAPQYVISEDVDVRGLYTQCNRMRGNVDFSITSTVHLEGMLVFDYAMTHVGVYIGNGKIIEAQGHAYGVVQNDAYDRRAKFTLWGVPDWLQVTTSMS